MLVPAAAVIRSKAPINARLRQSGRDKRYKQGSGINANKRSINANKRKRNYSSVNIAVPDQEPGIDAARVFGEEVLVSLGGPAGNRRVRGRGEQPRFADR